MSKPKSGKSDLSFGDSESPNGNSGFPKTTPTIDGPMTRKELELRKRLVIKVRSGIGGALARLVEAADCLRDLRDGRLYRNTHATFEEFCRDEFALTRWTINLRVQAAEVYRNLVDAKNGVFGNSELPFLPENESQVRYMVTLPEEQQPEVWARCIVEAGGKQPSTRLIRGIVTEVTGAKSKVSPEKRDRLLALRALNFLRSVNKPTKQVSAALSILSKEFESDADKIKTTKKGSSE